MQWGPSGGGHAVGSSGSRSEVVLQVHADFSCCPGGCCNCLCSHLAILLEGLQ